MAMPYKPASDSEVLERLADTGGSRRELRELRRKLLERPLDFGLALHLAGRYIELARADSDPRYNGYAESVLNPWLSGAAPPPEALVLRANLRQNRHDFGAALDDLSEALRRQPRMAQAWLTRAVILEVQGDYAAALQSCRPLSRLASTLSAVVCTNSALSLSGNAESAYIQIDKALRHASEAGQEALWAHITAAEIAERLAWNDAAEHHYRRALDLGIRSVYLLATYADFLLDRGRSAEVVDLLRRETRVDPLLLRLLLAETNLNLPEAELHRQTLSARFAASRVRGDSSHRADEARFALHVLGEAGRALELAKDNWSVQREPRDARILLEAALAAGRPDAAAPVLQFVRLSGLQDARLAALRHRIAGLEP
jgi:tetratricopeptide (TPR) repeat protein